MDHFSRSQFVKQDRRQQAAKTDTMALRRRIAMHRQIVENNGSTDSTLLIAIYRVELTRRGDAVSVNTAVP